jgi:hypothetical protein
MNFTLDSFSLGLLMQGWNGGLLESLFCQEKKIFANGREKSTVQLHAASSKPDDHLASSCKELGKGRSPLPVCMPRDAESCTRACTVTGSHTQRWRRSREAEARARDVSPQQRVPRFRAPKAHAPATGVRRRVTKRSQEAE